ncbi:Phr family secreted Rap phosphatase inhibitor [Bacillus cereus]|uniref:Phr family secreted Rap phosphatase inhibitor n=1 Tax=Bacillus sp. AFS023182 TaxID=2033492 RepID=UPI000BF86E69|nr:Phr family secreted Rap phosphatase inhibitor [Bacillus sp. AFS023182]PFE05162.1 Phr family secreted Rap phosphatase inhibitor [Bacillus sp. AFS023182]PGY03087.1 Phr family secreted Rap phosphatase inhibitor [Bacillus cereus]
MFKKIRVVVTGLALAGIVSVGLNSSFTQQANHGDVPAPANPDLAYNVGAPDNSHADFPAPKEI